jgi:tetratricopeptide (TPR) repeat protein
VKRNPRSLQAVVELADVLIIANKLDEALALADTAIARAKGNDEAAPPYDDVSEWLIWVMDKRANALTSLGRWDEAVEQFVKAGRRPERGSMNVSQAINLSFLYAALDRPMDALAAIDDIGTLSAYGRMQVEAVRHMAAIELNDAAAAEAALAYMREHKADAIETFQKALIRANRLDEASDALIARLNDPDLRNQALISLQNYIEMPATGRETEWATRSASVAHTPKVLAAIKKFGKIERYNLAPE